MTKRRKVRYGRLLLVIFTPIILVGLLFCLLFVNFKYLGKTSLHEDAKKYQSKSCLVFYPDSKLGKTYAKQICKAHKDNKIYDYVLVPYGDFYQVSYGDGTSYFTDKEYNELTLGEFDETYKYILADYLRYNVKKNNPDLYNSESFLNDSYVDNLDITNVTYTLVKDSVKVHFGNYDLDIEIPLKYIGKAFNKNFGYGNDQYVRPKYIDTSKPLICLTFDDGPKVFGDNPSSTEKIIKTLYKEDVCATFFVIGQYLESDYWNDGEVEELLIDSIGKGNEYGSHTASHSDLTNYSTKEEINKAINNPVNFLKNNCNYDIKIYRPTGGNRSSFIDEATLLPAILWNVDSHDWESDTSDEIISNVLKQDYVDEGDILLFHDCYNITANAIETIIPKLKEAGFEFVTVSELMNYYGISDIDYMFDSTYFE